MTSNRSVSLSSDDPFLRLPEVERQTGLSKSTIYHLIKENQFPAPVSLGRRASGWLLSEVNEWKNQRIKESRRVKGERA